MKLNLPGAEAYLMISESEHNADMYYATGFFAYDSFIYLNSGSDKILVSDMELGRARKESKVHDVIPTSRYNIMDKIRKNKDADAAYCEMIVEFLHSEKLRRISVPYNFPVQLADCLRKAGFEVIPIKSPFRDMREIKNEKDIKAIETAQRAGERVLSEALGAIRNASSRMVRGTSRASGLTITTLWMQCDLQKTVKNTQNCRFGRCYCPRYKRGCLRK
jgi:Xaa-Pro aminopeptidase